MAEKTVYPGMPMGAPAQNAPMGATPANGTVYPGMAPAAPGVEITSGKPLMGFFYSVSRTPYGEFWPLFVGPNTIGRSADNTVKLNEATVSGSHAQLVIRKMQQNGHSNGVSVYIQDTGSTAGTMLNGCTLDFNPQSCKSGDIITVGANYELYLVLIDADSIGLMTKDGFQSTAAAPAAMPAGMNPFEWGQGQAQPASNPFDGNAHKGTLPGVGFGAPAPAQATPMGQAQPASNPFDNRKATIYMPNKK